MTLNSLLGLARDALAAQSYGLDVTGQNVNNVNTPGYVRRDAMLVARPVGVETFGGVDAAGLRRLVDGFAGARYLDASGQSSSASQRDSALGALEGLFDDANGTGLGGPISQLCASFSALAANPSDPTARGQVLASVEGLASRLRDTAGAISSQRASLLDQGKMVASEVNERAGKIASLNDKIAVAQGLGKDAADLLDQRDVLVDEIAQRVDVKTFTDGSGRLVVRAAGGTLVEGNVAGKLGVAVDASGAMRVSIARPGGAGAVDVTGSLVGGTLAGLREARDVDAPAISDKLDSLAYGIATAVNGVHAGGFGLDGVGGRPLFSVSATPAGAASSLALDAAMVGHPERVAASSSAATLPGGSDLATKLAGLAGVATVGGQTAADAYGSLIGDVGLRKAGAAQDASVQEAMQSQAKSMRDASSGVSLDEEMINLSRYQRAYQAATKLMATVDQMMNDLVTGLVR